MNYYQLEVEVAPDAWSSELPADLLGMITDNLCLSEFIRFGCVCLGWRSFSIQNYQHLKLPDKLPVLIIPIPPSLLLLTDHHQKNISFPPSSLDDDNDDEEEEELELEEKEEKVITHEEEEKEEEKDIEIEIEIEIEKEKEIGIEKQEEKEIGIGEEKGEGEEEEEEEEEEERCPVFKRVNYYNPNETWEGQDAKQRHRNRRTFYSLSEKMVYHDFQLPVPYYKNIRGSSYGWLVTVEECYADNGQLYLSVRLLNPFRTDNNNEIQLPPITNGNPGNSAIGEKIRDSYFLEKAVLSANPSSLSDPTTQLVVFGIYGHFRLAFCRPGDKAWTRLDLEQYRPIFDVICYKDQTFAILQDGLVFAFVFDATHPLLMPIVTLEISPPNEVDRMVGSIRRYLVESGRDLFQILRVVDCSTPAESGRPYPPTESGGYITRQFFVFKLDPTGEWVEMKTLDGRMLFIGTSSSMSLSALDFPGCSTPNSIYYTDDFLDGFVIRPLKGPHDIGIFNLEHGTFERHYEAESVTVMPPPIWIQPML